MTDVLRRFIFLWHFSSLQPVYPRANAKFHFNPCCSWLLSSQVHWVSLSHFALVCLSLLLTFPFSAFWWPLFSLRGTAGVSDSAPFFGSSLSLFLFFLSLSFALVQFRLFFGSFLLLQANEPEPMALDCMSSEVQVFPCKLWPGASTNFTLMSLLPFNFVFFFFAHKLGQKRRNWERSDFSNCFPCYLLSFLNLINVINYENKTLWVCIHWVTFWFSFFFHQLHWYLKLTWFTGFLVRLVLGFVLFCCFLCFICFRFVAFALTYICHWFNMVDTLDANSMWVLAVIWVICFPDAKGGGTFLDGGRSEG